MLATPTRLTQAASAPSLRRAVHYGHNPRHEVDGRVTQEVTRHGPACEAPIVTPILDGMRPRELEGAALGQEPTATGRSAGGAHRGVNRHDRQPVAVCQQQEAGQLEQGDAGVDCHGGPHLQVGNGQATHELAEQEQGQGAQEDPHNGGKAGRSDAEGKRAEEPQQQRQGRPRQPQVVHQRAARVQSQHCAAAFVTVNDVGSGNKLLLNASGQVDDGQGKREDAQFLLGAQAADDDAGGEAGSAD